MAELWTDLTPQQIPAETLRHVLHFASALGRYVDRAGIEETEAEIEGMRRSFVRSIRGFSTHVRVRTEAYACVLSDLSKQGWLFRTDDHHIEGRRPVQNALAIREAKRRQLAARRNEQLREPATREFVFRMESGHLYQGRRVSIFSLMRDGRELASSLEAFHNRDPEKDQVPPIQPYIQVVERPCICAFSGFELTDIWRYFRHTWTTPYESVPGRSMPLLIRDAAAPFHPIIGISALSSAASVLPVRDDGFIRWSAEAFLADARIAEVPRARKIVSWLEAFIDRAIKELYTIDFIEEGTISSRLPRITPEAVIEDLLKLAKKARGQHFDLSRDEELKVEKGSTDAGSAFWERQARSPLFRAKRAAELADLLGIRNTLNRLRDGNSPRKKLAEALTSSAARKAIGKVVRKARAQSIGVAIADLSVCGAVAPYRDILGGKLVALLSVSPAAVSLYRKRYQGSASVIASSMAGRRIIRRPDLVYVGTTSLYGVRPNQYDGAKVPGAVVEANRTMHFGFRFLGNTQGYGTSQFGEATKEVLERLTSITHNGKAINNVFGEGANPRMRALREGIEVLGLPEELLVHGMSKSVYGVPMLEPSGLGDYLLGLRRRPKYLFARNAARSATRSISAYWLSRWVAPRLARKEVLERIRGHNLIHPIRHGARLGLPEADVDQLEFFKGEQ